ncbi:hypothetical protein TSOC_006035 [Tetrabaena socialis]|uniref:Dynein regulatory complex protein 12 n=1 Tax=Tetrabaena socialis TaxID=47790 RepID=A0A2J8A4N8_9CHLO|nr:hypothetical protein TSOC_006035 [Tetrabaena socialis]|eukprot:PNH07492.1 hypothetical protein TSOC_006035 [Tetrabaena socialis]
MPPKNGKTDVAKAAKTADKENLARAETEILSLQHLLELRSHEALEARRSERMWRERMEAFTQAIEQQKEDTLDITADMMRQYKGMQEQLLKKVSDLETETRQLRKLVEERDAELARLQQEKEQQKRASDLEMRLLLRRSIEAFVQQAAAAGGAAGRESNGGFWSSCPSLIWYDFAGTGKGMGGRGRTRGVGTK